jgi:hypothetical protein
MPTYRVKTTYPKPAGGFVWHHAILYGAPIAADPTRVLFRHHRMPEWIEMVPLEHLEPDPVPPTYRRRGC